MKENVFSNLSALFIFVFHIANAWLDSGYGGDSWFSANLSVL